MSGAVVEVLTFAGCPNADATVALAERLVRELGIEGEVRRVDVSDAERAQRAGFLGSPTIRVDGRDIEPGAQARTGYGLSCRVYRTEHGVSGRPDERWLRDALLSSGGDRR